MNQSFSLWMRRGLGRAVLYLRANDPRPYRADILDACLHSQSYDHQCEGHRALYMVDILRATGEAAWYLPQLQQALVESDDPDVRWQLYDLLAPFARDGDAASRAAIYSAYHRHSRSDDLEGHEAIVATDAIAGLAFLAEEWLRTPPIGRDVDYQQEEAIEQLERLLGPEQTREELRVAAAGSPAVAALLNRVEKFRAERHRHRPRAATPEPLSADEIREKVASDKSKFGAAFMGIGRRSTEAVIMELAQDIAVGAPCVRLPHSLRLFHFRAFPLDPAPIIAYVRHEEHLVWRAARIALANVCHPAVRACAYDLLTDAEFQWGAADLLQHNLLPEDWPALHRYLDKAADDEDVHDGMMGLRDIIEENLSPHCAPMLRRMYEEGPCTRCRGHVVEMMQKLAPLPGWMVEECRWDAGDHVRELVASSPSDA